MIYSKSFDGSSVQDLLRIVARINPVEIITPVNANEVKKGWIESVKDYQFFSNPTFRYDKEKLRAVAANSCRLEQIKNNFLNSIKPETEEEKVVFDILIKRIDQAIMSTEIAASIVLGDDEKTAELCQDIYGFPSSTQILDCYDIINGRPQASIRSRFNKTEKRKLKAMTFDAKEISEYFEKTLEFYGIDSWAIDISSRYTSIDVRTRNSTGKPTICIPEDREVDGLKLLELVGHEIESHLRSVENSRFLFRNILGLDSPLYPLAVVLAKSDDELLDEGQAKLSDVHINGSSAMPMPYYTVAIDQARRGHNFRDVAETIFGLRIKNGESVEEAAKMSWINTYRVFRGCTDTSTSNFYAYTKDYIYFSGYNIAKDIDPSYLPFASMGIDEIRKLANLGLIDLVKYKNRDAVKALKAELLSKE